MSRTSGLVRDLMMAFAFGDHPSVAAFMVAFRLSNLMRRLLGEGPLQAVFIPHYEGLRLEDAKRASYFFCKLTVLFTVLLLIATAFVELGFWGIFSFFPLTEGAQEILQLTGQLMPGILFICLYGLNISLLNCCDSFFIPSFAPFICNGIWIGAAFFLRNQEPAMAMQSLSTWIVIGFVGQWLITFPYTLRHIDVSWKEWFKMRIPPEVKTLAKSFSFGAIGVGAMQINALADAIFARYADPRGPAYLWYSIRLEQLALALFGIACTSTIVPALSRAIKAGNDLESTQLFGLSYKRIMTIMLPCTFALLALGLPAINVVYGRGHFTDVAVLRTTYCLAAYAISLVPTTLIMLFSAVFYARGNFRMPMLISVAAVVCHLLLNALFVFGLGIGVISVALATSFSAWINCAILGTMLKKEGWTISFAETSLLFMAASFAFMMVVLTDALFFQGTILMALKNQVPLLPKAFPFQAASFAFLSFVFVTAWALFGFIFRISAITDLLSFMKPGRATLG